MSDTKTKEPGQVHWEASQVFDERTIPWSEVDEGEKEKSRQIEASCREGFVPPTIRYVVMRWHKAFVAGNEDEAVARCDDVFSAAATLVLGEEGLKEAGKLHDAAIATSLDPFPVEAGFWYELRDGRISHCHHVADGIAHTALGHCNAEDGKSLSDSALDIVRKTKIRRRFLTTR